MKVSMKQFFVVITLLVATFNLFAQCHTKAKTTATHVSYQYNWSAEHEKDIVDIAVSSDNFSILVAAVKAGNLVETLKGNGPFTVFAPVNTAFEKLPDGTLNTLLKSENQATLVKILTYHVVAGRFDADNIIDAIQLGGGEAQIKTVQGGILKARLSGSNVILTDEKGGKSVITTTDVEAKNGIIHAIDMVVMPK
jgi:uncharacterized surface protein with fasciclin (FAS1) repeats